MPASAPARILIADDEETFLHATADLLRREGYDVTTAPDGLGAAAALNTGQYDVLIADIKMPGNADMKLVRLLPQIADGVPVIVVTGYPTPESAMASAELPVLGYLVKPVALDDLLRHVKRAAAHSAIFRANRAIRARLESWTGDVQSVEQLLSKATSSGIVPEAFVNLTMRNLLGCLRELDTMWKKSTFGSDRDALNDALTSAVRAFETTSGTVRSKVESKRP
jgi:DNA-binding NtrC family response regulator